MMPIKPIIYTAITLLLCWGLFELVKPFVEWARWAHHLGGGW